MLSNFDLENICREYKVPLKGVFMKDELLSMKQSDGNYIVNLQSTTDGNGSHWTALIMRGKEAFFFDSFGAPPSVEIIKFIKKKRGVRLAFNNWIIQDLKSDNCGYFCVALLIYIRNNLKKGMSLMKVADDFIDGFGEDSKINDELLKSFFVENTVGGSIRLIQRLIKEKHL